jgi:hypothetical protein
MTKLNKNEIAITPITDRPEYIAAIEKLSEFTKQRDFMRMSLDSVQSKIASLNANQNDGDVIMKATKLLNGEVEAPLYEKASKLESSIMLLEKAIIAQREAVNDIKRRLGADISLELAPLHKAITSRIVKAIEELSKANNEEIELRGAIESKGYLNVTLPTMTYLGAYDPKDPSGSIAYYWTKSAADYLA